MMIPSWQETFSALHGAKTREELWSVLLTPHGMRTSSAWEEPFLLFGRFHRDDPSDATITALLVCTDTRWRNGATRLIRQLADSGMLDDTALDHLASSFLEPQVAVVAVSEPSSGQSIAADADEPSAGNDKTSTDPATAGHLIVQRPVWPPLRRWAAARQVLRDPARWRDLLELASSSPSRDATAIAAGVMDAADLIPLSDRTATLEQGLDWGSGTVRLAALPGFARLTAMKKPNSARDKTRAGRYESGLRILHKPRLPHTPVLVHNHEQPSKSTMVGTSPASSRLPRPRNRTTSAPRL